MTFPSGIKVRGGGGEILCSCSCPGCSEIQAKRGKKTGQHPGQREQGGKHQNGMGKPCIFKNEIVNVYFSEVACKFCMKYLYRHNMFQWVPFFWGTKNISFSSTDAHKELSSQVCCLRPWENPTKGNIPRMGGVGYCKVKCCVKQHYRRHSQEEAEWMHSSHWPQ